MTQVQHSGTVTPAMEPCLHRNLADRVPDHYLPASEQLYFRNAPLAHVVAYEDRLRLHRIAAQQASHRWYRARRAY